MVRKHEKPLEQVIKRYGEILEFCKPNLVFPTSNIQIKLMKQHKEGPIVNDSAGSQFKIAIINNIKINVASISDCYVGFEEQGKLSICKIFNICKHSDDDIVFIIKLFKKVEPYFEKPLNSIKLGIAIVDTLSNNFIQINIQKTCFIKYMILSSNQNVCPVAFPVLHTNVN